MAYEHLIDQIINTSDPEFADFPEFLNGQKFIGYQDGFIAAPAVLDLDAARQHAKVVVDDKATEVRKRFISSGAGQEMIYLRKEQEAQAFKDAGYPEANIADYPLVEAEAVATDDTGQQAADAILAQAAIWVAAGANIERERRAGKIVIDQQLGEAGINAAMNNAIAALDAITP